MNFYRKLLIYVFVLLPIVQAAAQNEIIVPFTYSHEEIIVKPFGENVLVLANSESESISMDLYTARIISTVGQELTKSSLRFPKLAHFSKIIYGQNAVAILFEEPSKESIHVALLNRNGEKMKQMVYSESTSDEKYWQLKKEAYLSPSNHLMLTRQYAIYESAEKSKIIESGIEIINFDQDFNIQWQYKFKSRSEIHKTEIAQLKVDEEAIICLITEKAIEAKEFSIHISTLSKDGQLIATENLVEDGTVFYPSIIEYNEGNIYGVGNYYEKGWYASKVSSGIFVFKMNVQGEIEKHLTNWAQVQQKLAITNNGKNSNLEPTQTFIHDFERAENGYNLVCENYKAYQNNSNGSTEQNMWQFELKDIMTIELSSKGVLKSSDFIRKQDRTVRIHTSETYQQSVELDGIVRENNYFSNVKFNDGVMSFLNFMEKGMHYLSTDVETGIDLKKRILKIDVVISLEDLVESENSQMNVIVDRSISGMNVMSGDIKPSIKKDDRKNQERTLQIQNYIIGEPENDGILRLTNNKFYSFYLFGEGYQLYLKPLQ